MPSGPLRKRLRAAGHHLAAVLQVGKEGVSEAVVRQALRALGDHELVKVKVGTESPVDRFEAAERLGQATGSQVAQILGRTLLLYLRHPERSRFQPELAPRRAEPGLPASRRARSASSRTRGKRSLAGRSVRLGGQCRSPSRSRW